MCSRAPQKIEDHNPYIALMFGGGGGGQGVLRQIVVESSTEKAQKQLLRFGQDVSFRGWQCATAHIALAFRV